MSEGRMLLDPKHEDFDYPDQEYINRLAPNQINELRIDGFSKDKNLNRWNILLSTQCRSKLGDWKDQRIYPIKQKEKVSTIHLFQSQLYNSQLQIFYGVEFFNKRGKSILQAGDTKTIVYSVINVEDDEQVIGVKAATLPKDHQNCGLLYDVKFKIAKILK